ncbi:MAG TPA: hypothetical protein PK349_04350 [Candidatus Hydrogenedentes bacterium]|nr:hypothetical protein [Candidatus Hydrogenedentota bacterium]
MTDQDIHTESPDPETPRRLYNKPDSWIDLRPAEQAGNSAEPAEEPPRYVVLERQVVWRGPGCAGCLPGCLAGLILGLATIGISILWVFQRILLGISRGFRISNRHEKKW